jgi:hypothetical protein
MSYIGDNYYNVNRQKIENTLNNINYSNEPAPTSSNSNVGFNAANIVTTGTSFVGSSINSYNKGDRQNFGDIANTVGTGASFGAAIGTAIMPGVGTLVGAGIGAVAGGLWSGASALMNTHRYNPPAAKLTPYMQFASGGVASAVPAEVERGELVQLPQGGFAKIGGKRHEQGGVKTILPEGSYIFSNRITTDGKWKYNAKNTIANEANRVVTYMKKLQDKANSNAEYYTNSHALNSFTRKMMKAQGKLNNLADYQESMKQLASLSVMFNKIKSMSRGNLKFASGGKVGDKEVELNPQSESAFNEGILNAFNSQQNISVSNVNSISCLSVSS